MPWSRPLLAKEFREGRWKLATACLVLVALGIVLPATYGFVVRLLAETPLPVPLPPPVQRQVQAQLADLGLYLLANWHGKNLYQVLVVLALVFGAGAVAPEFGRGTAAFLFSRPVTRSAVVAAKAAAGVSSLAAAALIGTVALDVTARLVHGQGLPAGAYAGLVPAVAGAAVVFAVGVWWSVRTDDALKAGTAAAAVAAVLSVPSWLPRFQHLSVYVQMTARPLFVEGRFPWVAVAVLLTLAAAVLVAAARALEARDV